MIPGGIFKPLALAAAGLSLSGCVAAAIPLVAGGALARTTTDGRDAQVTVEAPAPPEPVSAEAAANMSAEIEMSAGDTALSGTGQGSLMAVPAPSGDLAFASSPALVDFVRYAGQQAFLAAESDSALATAVLDNPAALDGKRQECTVSEIRPASILIDLDTGDAPFDPDTLGLASQELALSLKVLRAEGVEVAWISASSAGSADGIRDALSRSGLDPQGQDQLLLLRYPGDRKQTRRKQLALETCLLAIAGDDRSDFDELYDFLNNPDAALELEPLFNNGWFLLDKTKAQEPEPDFPAPAPDITEEELPQ
ncbi:hypothetical protein [Erythrobacter sp. MTPC3]|uniref:hypothetical protein n=1 Tax=Erythrobacter sp. MTPC3 TaxID=3056564 RepID=UPI0036F22034